MGNRKWLTDIIKWVVNTFGDDIGVWLKDRIRGMYQRYFTNRNILVLGGKQTGKSSLIQFLRSGKPYEAIDGEKRSPNPTSGAAVIDKKVEIHKDQWLKIPKDVGGELAFRPLWDQMIRDCKPEGIIYMIDGRLDAKGLGTAVDEMRADVLSHFENDRQSLIAYHVFLNFADKWASSQREIRRRVGVVREAVERAIDDGQVLGQIRFDVSECQLSPDLNNWPEVNRAVHCFGAMLMDK